MRSRPARYAALSFDAVVRKRRIVKDGLRAETGFTEGKNLSIEFRFAEGQLDRLPEMAASLVHRPVAVLVAVGGSSSALVAKKATSTIPIAFVMGGDPVGLGLATSLARPGSNATGMTIISADLAPKRLGLLREIVPNATAFAALINPNTPRDADKRLICVRPRGR
jgi:putative ABC transport system substrate-binding protein